MFFSDANGWIFNADNGDVVMQGPIAIEPSYGQDATIQLRRNSTSLWSIGSGQNPMNDNAFYFNNINCLKYYKFYLKSLHPRINIIINPYTFFPIYIFFN